jgi:formylglycine-generating enzyme required for sulfatase activity
MWQGIQPLALGVTVAVIAAGCGHSSSSAVRPPAPGDIPVRVSITGGRVNTGVNTGVLRSTVDVSAFAISKAPVTLGQYRRCVAAGACTPPSAATAACSRSDGNQGATYSIASGTEDRPVTCVTSTEAAAFCGWVGGRLPRASEWTLAARGPNVQRYPWGLTPPTCSQRSYLGPRSTDCCGHACDADEAVSVGAHPAGDSPFGMSDVLLTNAELVGSDPTSAYPACKQPQTACIATGLQPGAIDLFVPERNADFNELVTSFRCAWEGAAQ